MQRNPVRNLLFVVVLIGVSSAALNPVMARADMNFRGTPGSRVTPLLRHASMVRAADAGQQLNLSIGLQLRDQASLDALLNALYDPQSEQYHQYLSPDQFTQLFAPPPDQVQHVISYLQSQGFTVTSVAPNNLLIDATGSVAQVQRIFHVQINTYRLGSHTFYANANTPSIPGPMSQLITSIGGLDDSLQYQPLYQLAQRHWLDTSNGPVGGMGPQELLKAYNGTPLHDSGVLGDNQTIGILELDGYQPVDVMRYFLQYGLGTPNISNVLVDGFSGAPGQGAIEDELDIELIAGIAPHANQIIYQGPNTTQGINDTYNRIVTDHKVQVVSTSWGLCEASSGNAELQTLDQIFKQGAAEGMTFVAASGDSGAYDCQDSNLAVDSPADDPYVTGVGGTSLQLNGGNYGSESAWSSTGQGQRGPNGSGGGGGLSNIFKQPNWQTGPGVKNNYSNGNREVPDVSAAANPTNGYSIYCTVTNSGCPPTGWTTVGGTSASSPFWAASLTLVNQYRQAHGKTIIGQANAALYKLINTPAFHDVTSGNNLYYPATSYYDMASGIGTPNLSNLADGLLNEATDGGASPSPSPTSTPGPPPNTNLISNGDFESGQADPWQEVSKQNNELMDSSNAHTGTYSAYLCGYMGCDDSIQQTFTLPDTLKKLSISYWWYSDTTKGGRQCQDVFSSRLLTPGGAFIRELQHSCNFDATNKWVQKSYDIPAGQLSAYKGKSITLFFHGTNAQGNYQVSDFFIDDVVVTVA